MVALAPAARLTQRITKRESSMGHSDQMAQGEPLDMRVTPREAAESVIPGQAASISLYLLAILLVLVTLTGLLALGLHH